MLPTLPISSGACSAAPSSAPSDIELVADTQCGEVALELVERFHPDTVVTELDLATIDGLELTRRVRSDYPEIHVVAYTSQGSAEKEMRAAGAEVFLMKGDARSLISALRSLG